MAFRMKTPKNFKPPIVKTEKQGINAFYNYDWYFKYMKRFLNSIEDVFLVPCAATKPIYSSNLHKLIYQKFSLRYGTGREILVVSEPVVLIKYEDLYDLGQFFCYEFPPRLLNDKSRKLFIGRLQELLSDKNITGCLPKHHSSLINDAVGDTWKNYWEGDIFNMIRKASALPNN